MRLVPRNATRKKTSKRLLDFHQCAARHKSRGTSARGGEAHTASRGPSAGKRAGPSRTLEPYGLACSYGIASPRMRWQLLTQRCLVLPSLSPYVLLRKGSLNGGKGREEGILAVAADLICDANDERSDDDDGIWFAETRAGAAAGSVWGRDLQYARETARAPSPLLRCQSERARRGRLCVLRWRMRRCSTPKIWGRSAGMHWESAGVS
jgi:hypothetical protein